MKADILREKYLEFFRSKQHKVAESDSLVPNDDPTVLFTPAGMNQFKKQFLGMITDFRRATSSQRCLRTDDLDKVGKTDCHHTFFEMLGNFSFGDYFKKEAIAWAWEFLTVELAIPAERLWVSVYKDDDEAYAIWRDQVKFPEAKIVRLGDHDNFWPADAKEKGPNGPCGPCSEIFIDMGRDTGCGTPGCNPSCSCGRFIEIWNLVFTQFNRKDGGVLEPLPQKNIDTGMGLERITAVMQGVTNNFQTDLFQPMIQKIRAAAKKNRDSMQDMYAITDHLRAVVFSIHDGVLPSNESRGYVVRKLIRKSVLHLRSLGIEAPFAHSLVTVLAEVMAKPYPELSGRVSSIAEVILSEEKNFITALNSSDALLEEKFAGSPDAARAGTIAFQLYDTHGIPLELTQDWLKKNGLAMSMESFQDEMKRQKERSKVQSSMKGDVFSVTELAFKGLPKTRFLGYETFQTQATVLKVAVDPSPNGISQVVFDATVFYAESGGQVHDVGTVEKDGTQVMSVIDVQKSEDILIHSGTISGELKEGDSVTLTVDSRYRMDVARNHTATHLLQAALRSVLGQHVQQQGSMVDQERLRFDFTHHKAVSRAELDRVEAAVNGYVMANYPVHKKEMALQEARQEGALAFFGEKYGEKVRIVSIDKVSKEFCGGTHLDWTGSIGLFKIAREESVASGVRRIEAVTGTGALDAVKKTEQLLGTMTELMKTQPEQAPRELEKRLKLIKELEKQISIQKSAAIAGSIDGLIERGSDVNGTKVIALESMEQDVELLRKMIDLIKQKEPRVLVIFGAKNEEKAFLVVGTNVQGFDAGAFVKQVAPEIGGSGGGRKDFAQAGGPLRDKLQAALEKAKATAFNLLGKT